jgi:pantoate--beta-alanine ligase
MNTICGIAELRDALAGPRRAGRRIGLVPTMGAFHDGHLALMRRARTDCDVVVVSLFVNPAQFNDPDDLEAYPRDAGRDARLAEESGVDYLFAPGADEIYPPGFATTISVAGISRPLEGEYRGEDHFAGVATVVTKLLNIVAPDVAYFGQKDAQQVLVIRRLVRDLDIPVAIEVCPTVRESDGLAMSSRNRRLSEAEREQARSLSRALAAVREALEAGERNPASARATALAELSRSGIEPEYLELVTPDTLEPLASLNGEVLAVVAARVGTTRLIDNELITENGSK